MRRTNSWRHFYLLFSLFIGGSPAFALEAGLTTAPNVPPFISRTQPETVVVRFQAREFAGELADGKLYKFWSFNGTVPGPMVRVRQGDTVEFHLSNHPGSQFPHSIDIHAVNGPGGGSAVSLAAPGEEKVFRFKTLYPGLYIYHCASPIPSIPAHIANGMYGLFLVEPKHGFPRVDHEFYVLESEFYTQKTEPDFAFNAIEPASPEDPSLEKEKNKAVAEEVSTENETPMTEGDEEAALENSVNKSFDKALGFNQLSQKTILELSMDKGLKEQPDYVVFNGRQGALLGENALKVNVGEKIRIFFGNIGPNGNSSFHIIGEVFDRVYLEGAVNGIVNKNVQTTHVPSAGATIVEFTIDVPGDYLLVDHSIFRIDKGAIGLISAVGEENPEIFESIK